MVATMRKPIGHVLLSALIAALMLVGVTAPVSGQGGNNNSGGSDNYDQQIDVLKNPLQFDTFPRFLIYILKLLLVLIASIAIVVIVISGFNMVMSRGNPEAATQAKKGVTWAIIGLIVALLSYAMISIVQNLVINLRA